MTAKNRISLFDSDRVWRDPKAKTTSFFCKALPVKVDASLIDELRRISESEGNVNVRVCLHESPDAAFHDMIILVRPGRHYPPHKHLQKGETWHIIEGRMGVFVFDVDGTLEDSAVVSAGEIYRLSLDTFHAVMPLGEYVIYHESKPGPFLGSADSIYPDWAPPPEDADAVAHFADELRANVARLTASS